MSVRKVIYLDYNATTPALPAVIIHVAEVLQQSYNASSVHSVGREAARLLEESRQKVATSVGAKHARVIFTASGTEANNLALKGLEGYKIAVSAVEHLSVLAAAPQATLLPVDSNGILNLEALEEFCQAHEGQNFLISAMWANNETGVIQPIRQIADIIHKYNGLFHSDASQALGKVPVNMLESGVDMLTLSAHKLGGAQGAAALVITKCVPLKAHITGGGQELGFRAGTHNIAAIAGFGLAAENVEQSLAGMEQAKALRDDMENTIATYAPKAVIVGKNTERLPNTSLVALPGMNYETQLIHFDLNGVAVSSGSACSSGKVGQSHVLNAMGIEGNIANCAIRVSLGIQTTKEEVNTFLTLWKALYDRAETTKQHAA